jgi:hypothetical protein
LIDKEACRVRHAPAAVRVLRGTGHRDRCRRSARLIPDYQVALAAAFVTIVVELVTLSIARWPVFGTGFVRSFVAIALAGVITTSVSALLGAIS